MTNRTYTDLLAQISALGGVPSYSAADQARVLALANRRLRMAYDASRVWPRYLVVGEARAVTDSVVPYTEADKDDISEFMRVHREAPFNSLSGVEYSFYVSSDGAHLMQTIGDEATVYVTYKKAWDGPFAADSTAIPGEFFNYVGHAVYADMVRSGGQADKALQEEALANEMLALELQRAEQLVNNSPIGTRISTHASRQFRYY